MFKFDISPQEIDRALEAFLNSDVRKIELVFDTSTIKVYCIGENTVRVDITKNN